jgi:hypothetical protein
MRCRLGRKEIRKRTLSFPVRSNFVVVLDPDEVEVVNDPADDEGGRPEEDIRDCTADASDWAMGRGQESIQAVKLEKGGNRRGEEGREGGSDTYFGHQFSR